MTRETVQKLHEIKEKIEQKDADEDSKKSEVETQSELEKSRGWIRNINSRLVDNKLKRMIQESSNGNDILKTEIK